MRRIDFKATILFSLIGHACCFYFLASYKTEESPETKKPVIIEIVSEKALPTYVPPTKVLDKNQIIEQNKNLTTPEAPPTKTSYLSEKNQSVKNQMQAKARGHTKEKAPNKNRNISENSQINEMASNQSGSEDFIQGIDEGMETLLSTREFKYYAYYSKIKKQISKHWEGNVKSKVSQMMQSGRRIASTNKITKLLIVLNSEGTLVKVQVLSDSGLNDLDDAAIEAFNIAQPFPPPPKGIIDSDGTVKIRWDFILES